MRRCWQREEVQESQGPRVPRSRGPKVQGSQGPKDQDISNSHSNTSLTLKKVHLVHLFATVLHYWEVGRGGVTAAIVTVQVWTPLAVVTVTSETRQSSSDVPILLRLRHKLSSVSTVSRKIFTVKKNIYNRIWVTADGETTHKWLRICWHCFYLLSIVPVTTECNKIYLLMQCNFILNSTWKGDHGPLQYFWMWKEPAVFGAPTLFSRQSMDGFDSNLVQILMAS